MKRSQRRAVPRAADAGVVVGCYESPIGTNQGALFIWRDFVFERPGVACGRAQPVHITNDEVIIVNRSIRVGEALVPVSDLILDGRLEILVVRAASVSGHLLARAREWTAQGLGDEVWVVLMRTAMEGSQRP